MVDGRGDGMLTAARETVLLLVEKARERFQCRVGNIMRA